MLLVYNSIIRPEQPNNYCVEVACLLVIELIREIICENAAVDLLVYIEPLW